MQRTQISFMQLKMSHKCSLRSNQKNALIQQSPAINQDSFFTNQYSKWKTYGLLWEAALCTSSLFSVFSSNTVCNLFRRLNILHISIPIQLAKVTRCSLYIACGPIVYCISQVLPIVINISQIRRSSIYIRNKQVIRQMLILYSRIKLSKIIKLFVQTSIIYI